MKIQGFLGNKKSLILYKDFLINSLHKEHIFQVLLSVNFLYSIHKSAVIFLDD